MIFHGFTGRLQFLNRWSLWFWRALALLHLALFLGYFVPSTIARTDRTRDLVIYHDTALRVASGQPLYIARPAYGPDQTPFDYLYLPPVAAALSVFAGLDFLQFARLWTLILLACWLGFALVLVKLSGHKLSFWSFSGACFCIGLVPGAHRALALGQIDPVLWLLFGFAIWAFTNQKSRGSLFIALASLVKIYSFWTLFALRGTWRLRVWLGALAIFSSGLLFGLWVCGAESYYLWLKTVPPVVGQGSFNADNFSLSMGILRLARFVGWDYNGGPLGTIAKLWLTGATALGPLLALYLFRKKSDVSRAAWVGVIAALCAPLCWSTYLPLILVPLALEWYHIWPKTPLGSEKIEE